MYKKIFDLKLHHAIKLYNSSYLEELTGLIEKAASSIDIGTHYYFDDKYYLKNVPYEPSTSYNEFINSFKNSFEFSSSDKIHIIRGRAGIGKTLFFKQGVQMLIRNKTEHKDKYIRLGVDFKNIDSKQSIIFYTNLIYDQINQNAVDAIRQLGATIFDDFNAKFNRYCGDIKNTPYANLYPVMYFCRQIYSKYRKPCIIILDNIDLSCVKTQKNVFKATAIVCEKLYDFMKSQGAEDIYRIYFAMRPETYLHSEEMKLGKVIDFPLPNIQAICLEIIKTVLIETANTFDNNKKLKCEVTYYSIINNEKVVAKTFLDVANYFNEIFSHYLNDLWNRAEYIQRLGTNEEFHCNIAI